MAYIDIYPLRDERTVLDNPHKGWYWHYIDCGYKRPRYRDREELIGDPKEFPALKHIYLRFDWVDINPSRGVYDLSYLDEIMDRYGSEGYRFSMRMCTCQSFFKRWDNNQRATPAYVRERSKGYTYYNKAWEADYSDEYFIACAAETLGRLGQRYDRDERLEYIDIGTFGKYGEGNTRNNVYDLDVLKRHADIHLEAFPNTLIFVNDDMIRHNPSVSKELADYCIEKGIALRDDSITVEGPSRTVAGYDTLRDPRLFDAFSGKTPIDIEFAHAELIPTDVWKSGFPALEALRRTKATFAGFHDYPGRFLETNGDFAEYCANRLGYWFRPDELTLNADGTGSITMTNLGWAPSYRDYELKLYLTAEDGSVIDRGTIARTAKWKEQQTLTENFAQNAPIPHGRYAVSIAMYEDNGAFIELAINKKYLTDGKYNIGNIEI